MFKYVVSMFILSLPYMFIGGALCFILQIWILNETKREDKLLRIIPLILCESLPVFGILYEIISRPSGFIFDWKDGVVIFTWIAIGIYFFWWLAGVAYNRETKGS